VTNEKLLCCKSVAQSRDKTSVSSANSVRCARLLFSDPWESVATRETEYNGFSRLTNSTASQKFSHISWHQNFQYHIHSTTTLVFVLIQSIRFIPSHSLCSRSILILSFYQLLCLPNYPLPTGFPTKYLYTFLFSQLSDTYNAHFIAPDLVNLATLCEKYKS
jgi:hypothetical protein